jgi:phage terminase small subunit
MAKKLNARQRIFVQEYVWGQFSGNGADCARLAGFKDRAADHAAYQVLRKAHVRAAVEAGFKEKRELIKIRALRWVEHLERLLEVDPKDLVDAAGNGIPVSEMPENARRALAGVEIEELWDGRGEDRKQIGIVRKYKLHDKKGAAETLLKWSGELKDNVKLEVDGITLDQLVPRRAAEPAKE